MQLDAFLKYIIPHPTVFGVVFDKDDVVTRSADHWANMLEKRYGLQIDRTSLFSVPQLYDQLPRDERFEEMEAWLSESFLLEQHYHDIPIHETITEAAAALRAAGGEILGCLTARRERLRHVTERQIHATLGEIPVLLRPDDMEWDNTYDWKASILVECWPYVQGIVEDNPKIIPALKKVNYQGTVWLYRSPAPANPGIRVVPCPTHADAINDMRELIRAQR